MKTLLLDKTGNVYKILSEWFSFDEITYLCELGKWCPIKGDYLFEQGLVERVSIHETDVEIIDTNTQVIINAKSSMMGFDLDYMEDTYV